MLLLKCKHTCEAIVKNGKNLAEAPRGRPRQACPCRSDATEASGARTLGRTPSWRRSGDRSCRKAAVPLALPAVPALAGMAAVSGMAALAVVVAVSPLPALIFRSVPLALPAGIVPAAAAAVAALDAGPALRLSAPRLGMA